MEPSFVSKKCKFWVQDIVIYCLQKAVTLLPFSHNCHHWLLEHVLILYSSRCNISVGLHAVVVKTCVFELIILGVCEVNVMIWLLFHHWSTQPSVYHISCLRKTCSKALSSVQKSAMKSEPEHQEIYGKTCVYFSI
jgi:hypothetical protein